jgi:hypothetical protein
VADDNCPTASGGIPVAAVSGIPNKGRLRLIKASTACTSVTVMTSGTQDGAGVAEGAVMAWASAGQGGGACRGVAFASDDPLQV